MRLRALVALGLASLGFVLLSTAAPATAAPVAPHAYPVTTCSTLSVSTENPKPGQSITVTGTHFAVNASVKLVLRKSLKSSVSYNLGTFTTDSAGSFSASVTLPASITNGGHFFIYALTGVSTTQGKQCPADPYQSLQLAAATASTTGGSSGGSSGGTANTGLDIAALLVLAAGLVTAGVVINRRGRAKASARA